MNEHPDSVDFLLEPDDNLRLANLCGQFDEHLRQVESRLGVEINNRGNRFRVIGEANALVGAERVLRSLYKAAGEEVLSPSQVHLYLQDSGVEALAEVQVRPTKRYRSPPSADASNPVDRTSSVICAT